MTNLIITIVLGVTIALVLGFSALELFQSARDNYDQQILWLRLEQTGAAIKSKIKIIDGLPVLPMPDITGSYPAIPNWISANALDTQGNKFVYCPYALRSTLNTEGPGSTIPGANYNVVTYGSPITDDPSSSTISPAATLTPSSTFGNIITLTASSSIFSASSVGKMVNGNLGNAIITGYTNGTTVTASIGTFFASTSAIASGSWTLSPNSYVVGSDKPSLYSISPATTLTPSATSGYGVTFTAGSGVFSAASVGETLTSGTGTAVITAYTNSTTVTATITSAFASTSAIASGSWTLGASAPKGLLGYIIAFKPHDTYSATTAQNWCGSANPINITASGAFTTTASGPSGLVYPIIAAQSLYQQAAAKQDLVTLYVNPTASGDGTGRNPANYTTIDGAFSQLAALRPYRAKLWLTSGNHTLTNVYRNGDTTSYPSATLTPSAVSGAGVTFTTGGAAFAGTASDIGKIITYGNASAIITGFTDTTHATGTITSVFENTSAISNGFWSLTTPTQTYPSTTLTAAATTGSGVVLNSGIALFSVASVGQTVVGNSGIAIITGYTDSTHVLATITTPFSGTSFSSGAWALNSSTDIYDKANLRQIQYDIQGTGLNTTNIALCTDFDLPVNMILRSVNVDTAGTCTNTNATPWIKVRPNTRWIINNSRLHTVGVSNGEMWFNGSSIVNADGGGRTLVVTDGGRVVINGTLTTNATNQGIDLQPGRIDILPGATWNITLSGTNTFQPFSPFIVRAGGKLSNSGTMSITSDGSTQMYEAMNIVPGGQVFMNNATLSINSGNGTAPKGDNGATGGSTGCPGALTACKCPGAICNGGEIYLDNSGLLFPGGTFANTAAVALVDGGKYYMHNGSYIGSSGTAAQRPYWGVYDNGGAFVGGSSTGYTSGASGEGGSPQSNVYVANTSGAQCWAGNLLPSSPTTGSTQQQRHLFWDSAEGNGTTSKPRGTNLGFANTSPSTTSMTIAATGTQNLTITSGLTVFPGDSVIIVSTANVANYMIGTVTSYSAGALVVNVTSKGGSGTFASWNVSGGLDMRHLILANQSNWACTNPNTITSPSNFAFRSSGAASCNASYITEMIEPTNWNTGTTNNISIAATGATATASPQYQVYNANGTIATPWTSSTSTITPGQSVQVQVYEATTNSATTGATLTIGTATGSVSTTTTSSCIAAAVQTASSTTASSSGTLTFGSNFTVGDLVVIAMTVYEATGATPPTITAVSDNGANVYTRGGGNSSGTNPTTGDWYAYSHITHAANTVTVTGANVTSLALIGEEYPITLASPFDKASSTIACGIASATSTQTDDLAVGFLAYSGTSVTAVPTPTGYPTSNQINTALTNNGANLTVTDSNFASNAVGAYKANYTAHGTAINNFCPILLFKTH